MSEQLQRDLRLHRAIGFLIEAEIELEGIDRESELRAANLRHSLYRLLGFDNGRDYSDENRLVGILHVETDDDFSLFAYGSYRGGCEFQIEVVDIDDLDKFKILGPHGTPRKYGNGGTKCHEYERGIEAIKANPTEYFDNTGGNRGVTWTPLNRNGCKGQLCDGDCDDLSCDADK